MKQNPRAGAPAIARSRKAVRNAPADGRLDAWVARLVPEVVAATFAFMPASQPALQSATIRFTGRRLGVNGKPRPADRFVHDVTIDNVLAGSGPVAITPKIQGVNAGEWSIAAKMVSLRAECGPQGQVPQRGHAVQPVYPAAWSWRRWKLTEGPANPVATCLAPLARAPGVIVGIWGALSLLGFGAALVAQHLVISADRLRLHHVLSISLAAIVAGVVGAKLWYVVLHRRGGQRDGWCIQGLVLGIAVVAPPLLVATGTSIGAFFDASAPGLLFGMGIGRLGCFFAGCCCGRPTASRWGVWSSNRRPLGLHRIPTQLIESAFTLTVGAAVAVAVLNHGPARGIWFASSVAAYTIGRQGILRWREEQKSRVGGLVTAAIAAVVLLSSILLLALGTV
jgi:phosphatidylglycerol:prolipoprotein diacylglycerol transferase